MMYKCFVSGYKTGYANDTKQRKNEGRNNLRLFHVRS